MEKSKKLIITFQDIFQYLTRFVKYWKTGALLFLLGVTLSVGYYTYGKPTYYSRSLVAFDTVSLPIKSETTEAPARGKWGNVTVIVVSSLNSRWLVEHTAKKLGLIEQSGQYETIRDKYVSSARVSLLPGNILQIEVYAYQPWLVRAWPEAMIAAYKEYTLTQRARFRDNAIVGYTEELNKLKERIVSEDNATAKFEEDNKLIEQYVSNNGLESVPGEMLTIKTRLDSMKQVLDMVEKTGLPIVQQLSLMKKFRGTPVPVGTIVRRSRPDALVMHSSTPANTVASLTSDAPLGGGLGGITGEQPPGAPGANAPSVIVVPSMVEQLEPWEKTERELRSALQKREQAAKIYLAGHEIMRNLDREIQELEASLQSEVSTAVTSFKLEMAQMEARFEELQKKMPDYRKVLNDFDHYKQEYGLMTSGKVLWEAAYGDLRKRLATMEHTGIDMRVDFEFLGFTMMVDEIPLRPNKQKLLLYGLMLGVGCAGVGCFGLEKLRSTTSLVTETEKITGLNAVGVVPLVRDIRALEKMSIEQDDHDPIKDVHIGETFRIIGCSLPLHVARDNRCQVIMVSSSRPSEGKTMVSSLLARSFAEAGQRTLLIDADMRRGRVHRVFDMNQTGGLSGFLSDDGMALAQLITKTEIPFLDVLTRGNLSKPRFEALSTERFMATINELRKIYDRVIIDTPPLLGLADSIMVSRCVDGTVFVIRADHTTQRDIVTALEVLRGTNTPIYGFVLNGVDLSKMENYYYYSSYYPKYYDPSYLVQSESARV